MKIIYLLVFIIVANSCSTAQNDNGFRTSFRIMFYNVENFFDVVHDTLKNDYQFLPDGDKHWTYKKYNTKVSQLSKVITSIGGWEPPEIIGLCEVENRHCIESLTKYSPLKKFKYEIIHKESPDNRGIDVVLLYQPNKFIILHNQFIEIKFPNDSRKTRDIIYAKGVTDNDDTLHVFVNHWPSRWGGQVASEPKRIFVASVLRAKIDSIVGANKRANIIITGDFNDMPNNLSLAQTLVANIKMGDYYADNLYNLSSYAEKNTNIGTNKYRGEWGMLDQFIVSGALLDKKSRIFLTPNDYNIFDADYLLEPDEKYFGKQPNRTYIGFKYHGGYSDHLPVYIDLFDNISRGE